MIVYEIHSRNKLGFQSSTFVPLVFVREMELFMNLTGHVCTPMLLRPAEYLRLPNSEKAILREMNNQYWKTFQQEK